MSDSAKTTASLLAASKGFDDLFSNRIADARLLLAAEDSPFHLMGLGVCSFLEAALSMETSLMAEAAKCLALSEAAAKKQSKASKSAAASGRFPAGVEWEILLADTVVLQGLVHALSESYMGYVQCLYALNSAHSKFTKLYKTVFPVGMDSYVTPATTPLPSRNPSTPSLASSNNSIPATISTPTSSKGYFFGWKSTPASAPATQQSFSPAVQPQGPVEEFVVSGAAFGFGLFNLVFSLLPVKVKSVVGFLGFQHDRRLALQALAVAAARQDVHAVFASLTLMSYHGIVLLLAGYQADEQHIVKQYQVMVDSVYERYPDGSLWILNRAKILRMTYDPDGAIRVLKDGLRAERPGHFRQADALLVFELAWTLLSERRYDEAADAFTHMTEMNSWSHTTYYAIAAGCLISAGNRAKAKQLLDAIPRLLETQRKIGGKEVPTEALIIPHKWLFTKRSKSGEEAPRLTMLIVSKLALQKAKMGIFWNMHSRCTEQVARAHINELMGFTPPISVHISDAPPASSSEAPADLDTPDELAIRSLILGILHRRIGDFKPARLFFEDAHRRYADAESKWIGGVSLFELSVLDLKEAEANDDASASGEKNDVRWPEVLKRASDRLEKAMAISGSNVDLSSRLDTRVNMLRDEIALKKELLGL